MRPPRTGPLIVLGLVIVAAAVVVSVLEPWGHSTPVGSSSSVATSVATFPARNGAADDFSLSLSDGETWVHVVGEVRAPGLYSVAIGSRVVDAIMAAGGLSDNADECGINLARPLNDGEQLVVPVRVGDAPGCGAAGTGGAGANGAGASAPISLSRADVSALDTLPGIGPTLAQRIIDWRTANGGFSSVDQLRDVSGIGDKLFATLQPLVTP